MDYVASKGCITGPQSRLNPPKYGFISWKYLCNYKENRTVFKPASLSIVSLKVSQLLQVALLGQIHSAVA